VSYRDHRLTFPCVCRGGVCTSRISACPPARFLLADPATMDKSAQKFNPPPRMKSPSPLLPNPPEIPTPTPPLLPLPAPFPFFPQFPQFLYHDLFPVHSSNPLQFPPYFSPQPGPYPHHPLHAPNFVPSFHPPPGTSSPISHQIPISFTPSITIPPPPPSVSSFFPPPPSDPPSPNIPTNPPGAPSHPSSFENNPDSAPSKPPSPYLAPISSPPLTSAAHTLPNPTRRPPPLSKEDPQRDYALLPMVIDLVSEKPTTRWSYDAFFHALHSEIYTQHTLTSTLIRPYRVKALIEGSRNSFVLFFNQKNHVTEFVKLLPPTLTHPSSKVSHRTKISWPGHVNSPVSANPRFTLFGNVPLRALVDSYNTSSQSGQRMDRNLSDSELQKVVQTVILEPSKGAILECRLASADGGVVLLMANRASFDTALKNGLSLQNLSSHIFELHPPCHKDRDDPFLCGYCAQYTPHEGLMFCPNPPRCLTCGESGHAEARSSIRVKCPFDRKHPKHNPGAINTCIHCDQTHRAGSRSCPVWAQAKLERTKAREAKQNSFTRKTIPPPPPTPKASNPWHKLNCEHIISEIREIVSEPCDRSHGPQELPASVQMENKLARVLLLIDFWFPNIGSESENSINRTYSSSTQFSPNDALFPILSNSHQSPARKPREKMSPIRKSPQRAQKSPLSSSSDPSPPFAVTLMQICTPTSKHNTNSNTQAEPLDTEFIIPSPSSFDFGTLSPPLSPIISHTNTLSTTTILKRPKHNEHVAKAQQLDSSPPQSLLGVTPSQDPLWGEVDDLVKSQLREKTADFQKTFSLDKGRGNPIGLQASPHGSLPPSPSSSTSPPPNPKSQKKRPASPLSESETNPNQGKKTLPKSKLKRARQCTTQELESGASIPPSEPSMGMVALRRSPRLLNSPNPPASSQNQSSKKQLKTHQNLLEPKGSIVSAFAMASGPKKPKTARAPPQPSSSPKPMSTGVEDSAKALPMSGDTEHSTINPSPQNSGKNPNCQKT